MYEIGQFKVFEQIADTVNEYLKYDCYICSLYKDSDKYV